MPSVRAAWLVFLIVPAAAAEPIVEFNRDVRPILSDHCYQCHGPDRARRKAGLRLDTEEGVRAVTASGKSGGSELFRRVIAADPAERMPPRAGRPLSQVQVDTLKRWIEQGATWQKHWAFIPPRRPSVPTIRNPKSEDRNPIDAFIIARLEKEGLLLSPEADRLTLLRRVTLDLTGLPPTPAEVKAAREDASPGWYEKVVDRLLGSPRFGERMAIDWLDAARYADSNGYQSDGERFMWRWRDWVIEALNANLPFDRFTIEQLAGDLLPNPTLDQRIATGFNRNHRGNAEGGIVPEEYAVEYVVDRVDTTMAVWQGLTLGCARCHEHKYDPFTQKEYYRLFAFFNNVPEWGRAIKYGNSPPMIPAPTRQQREQLRTIEARLAQAGATFAGMQHEIDRAQATWEQAERSPADWTVTDGLSRHFPLDDGKGVKCPAGDAKFVDGRLAKAVDLDGKRYLDAGDVGAFGFYDRFSLALWVKPRGKDGVLLSRVNESLRGDGYMLQLENGKVRFALTKRWLDDAVRVESEQPLAADRWQHVVATYDGSRVASGLRIYVDGQRVKVKVLLDELNQSFDNTAPFRIGAGGGAEGRFDGTIDDVRVFNRCLTDEETAIVSVAESIREILTIPSEKRSPAQARKLRACFLTRHAPEVVRKAHQELTDLRRERNALVESFPTTMVMEEMPTPRDSHVLTRGQYDKRGEKVTPGLPHALESAKSQSARNRLDLARWLVSAENPLTARVTVNRCWQLYFGTGLVKTAEDFGSQGEAPSHPELLDWMAVEFRDSGWDVKRLHRLIVTSATYRQSSKVRPELVQKDPANRLLARGPRLRLPAETIRDQALFVSGLLVERLGGPSVKTYQPPGLWEELAGVEYRPDRGEALYRRSMYIFWKRTVTPPTMATFDATAREACTVNRARTNTPLQALALLNDVPFVESARVLAERVLRNQGTTDDRLKLLFLHVTGREPGPAELQVLRAGLERHRQHYLRNENAAQKLIAVGTTPPDPKLDVRETAAWTAIATLVLNLDEVVTRE